MRQLEAALALGRTAVKVDKRTAVWDWCPLSLGMAEYRRGNYAAANEALLAAEKAGPNNRYVTGTSPFYGAMSQFRRGNEEEPRKLAIAAAATQATAFRRTCRCIDRRLISTHLAAADLLFP